MSAEALSLPTILIRGRSVMALVVAPEWPLEDWLAALDQQADRNPFGAPWTPSRRETSG
jgi:hypothetical protein